MPYCLRVNPVDLQDRHGFLSYLNEKAEEGQRLVRCIGGWCLFRKDSPTPGRYILSLAAEDTDGGIKGTPRGFVLRPGEGGQSPEPGNWEADLVPVYFGLFFGDLSRRIRQTCRWISFPLLFLVAFTLSGQMGAGRGWPSGLVAWAVVLGLCMGAAILGEVLRYSVNGIHYSGLKAAAQTQRAYRTDPKWNRLIWIKNFLSCMIPVAEIVTVGMLAASAVLFPS